MALTAVRSPNKLFKREEWYLCVICGHPFIRRTRGLYRGNNRTTRRYGALTCSKLCSRKWGKTKIPLRNSLKAATLIKVKKRFGNK